MEVEISDVALRIWVWTMLLLVYWEARRSA